MQTQEEIAVYHKAYDAKRYAENPERRKKAARIWREANPERHAANAVAWNARNPEQKRAHGRAAAHRRRLRLREGAVESFLDIEIFARDEWVCKICGDAIESTLQWPDPMSVSLDHIVAVVNGGDHTRNNVQASHLRCNLKKNRGI